MPESCATMSCPSPAGDLLGGGTGDTGSTGDTGGILGGGTGGDTSTGGDTADTGDTGTGDSGADDEVESPVAGYKCKRRAIYRPDLKKHKTYKVCRPMLSDEERAAVAERFREMKARWKAAKKNYRKRERQQWASYHPKRRDAEEDDGED